MKKINDIFENTNINGQDLSWLNDEDFTDRGWVHNWRRYVSDNFISNWKELTFREKKIIYFMADEQASREEWD